MTHNPLCVTRHLSVERCSFHRARRVPSFASFPSVGSASRPARPGLDICLRPACVRVIPDPRHRLAVSGGVDFGGGGLWGRRMDRAMWNKKHTACCAPKQVRILSTPHSLFTLAETWAFPPRPASSQTQPRRRPETSIGHGSLPCPRDGNRDRKEISL